MPLPFMSAAPFQRQAPATLAAQRRPIAAGVSGATNGQKLGPNRTGLSINRIANSGSPNHNPIDKAYGDLMKSFDTGLQSQLGMIGDMAASDRRRAATLSGMAGGSFGGSLLAGQRQAGITAMRSASEATVANDERKRKLQIDLMKERLGENNRAADKEFEREMLAKGQAHDIEMMHLQNKLDPNAEAKREAAEKKAAEEQRVLTQDELYAALNPNTVGAQTAWGAGVPGMGRGQMIMARARANGQI